MISSQNLQRFLGHGGWPRIFDMRSDEEIAGTPRALPSARRAQHGELAAAAEREPDSANAFHVVYCAKGGPRAEAAAAILRAAGVRVESLEGGIAGWLADDGPTVSAPAFAEFSGAPSQWITRARPKIDRIACPWLIRRFLDRRAVIHYVRADTVEDSAAILAAEPFDIPRATYTHDGDACSFDAFIKAFDIRDEALDRVATIVRGADTARLDLAPECAGLAAMSLGLSSSFESDEAMLAAGLTLYDALYVWARHATNERHNWPSKTA